MASLFNVIFEGCIDCPFCIIVAKGINFLGEIVSTVESWKKLRRCYANLQQLHTSIIAAYFFFFVLQVQYLPKVWERARAAYVKGRFSPRSQKSNFWRGTKIFFRSSHYALLLPQFFLIFITKGRAVTNKCKSLGTQCRTLLKTVYFAGL
jgi:hypothetical protein